MMPASMHVIVLVLSGFGSGCAVTIGPYVQDVRSLPDGGVELLICTESSSTVVYEDPSVERRPRVECKTQKRPSMQRGGVIVLTKDESP